MARKSFLSAEVHALCVAALDEIVHRQDLTKLEAFNKRLDYQNECIQKGFWACFWFHSKTPRGVLKQMEREDVHEFMDLPPSDWMARAERDIMWELKQDSKAIRKLLDFATKNPAEKICLDTNEFLTLKKYVFKDTKFAHNPKWGDYNE